MQVTFIISAYAFISPLSSSMIALALDQIRGDLRIPSGLQSQMVLSIFVLAYAFGPFVLSPSSEIWGRISVIRYGNLVFLYSNLRAGLLGRRMSSLLSASVLASVVAQHLGYVQLVSCISPIILIYRPVGRWSTFRLLASESEAGE